MPDITPITSSEKISPIEPIKQQKTKESLKQEDNPYIESSEPIDPECLEQVKKDLANYPQIQHQSKQLEKNASSLKETQKKWTEEDLNQIKQELDNLHRLPKEQLQDLNNQLQKNLSQLQTTLLELKKQKKVDAEKAGFILDAITEISSKDFTEQDKQKLKSTLDALEKKVTELVANKQIKPQEFNVLMLFLAFAKAQMDQNDKAMLAGIDQTKVKTTQLELQAEKVKDNASQSTQGNRVSWLKTIAIGLAVIAVCVVVGAITGGLGLLALGGIAGAFSGATLGVALGTGVAAASVLPPAIVANSNPDAAGVGGLTERGPDNDKILYLQTMLNYLNTETQKLSSQLGSTQKLLVEDTSTRSTQLGQQAGQAITELGEIMKSR